MKIAYLILAHNNFCHLRKLVDSLNDCDVSFFIHFDKKVIELPTFDNYPNVNIINKRVFVNWGGFSIVEATLELLQESYSNSDFDRYVLLSGTDYPVKAKSEIKEYFLKNKKINFINVTKMPSKDKNLDRIYYFFIEGGYRNNTLNGKIIKIINKVIRIIRLKRKYPIGYDKYILYAGSQWWAFERDFVKYLMKFIKENSSFIDFYKNTFIPDEMFFQTIIMNSPFNNSINNSLTYSDWSMGEPPYPSIISHKHLEIIKQDELETAYGKTTVLFARKFSDKSENIIEKIDEIRGL